MKKILSVLMVIAMLAATFAMLAVPTSAAATAPTNTFDASMYSTTKVFIISTKADLLKFYEVLVIEEKTFEGKTVKLAADIELNSLADVGGNKWYENEEVTPLFTISKSGNDDTNVRFCGTFDGQGHTLTGIYIDGSQCWNYSAGLFPYTKDATIMNLTMDGFYIRNNLRNANGGVWPNQHSWGHKANTVGALIGTADATTVIDTVTIRNGIVTTAEYDPEANMAFINMGALIGSHALYQSNATTSTPAILYDSHLKVLNTVIEDTVELIPGEGFIPFNGTKINPNATRDSYIADPNNSDVFTSTAFIGGVIGLIYTHTPLYDNFPAEVEPYGDGITDNISYDFNGSNINPKNADSMRAVGKMYVSEKLPSDNTATETYEPSTPVTLPVSNAAGGSSAVLDFPAYEDATSSLMARLAAVNDTFKSAKFYGSDYAAPSTNYTITWKVAEKDNFVGTTTVGRNAKPVPPKFNVERETVGDVAYEFLGWAVEGGDGTVYTNADLPVAVRNTTYVAQYRELSTYTVTWVRPDKEPIVQTYRTGDTLDNSTIDTTRDETEDCLYFFMGWSIDGGDGTIYDSAEVKQIVVESDMTFTAEYETVRKFTVTWVIEGKQYPEGYREGSTPKCRENTKKKSDDEYTYKLIGWTTDGGATVIDADKLPVVTADVTYTAVYEKISKNPTADTGAAAETGAAAATPEKKGCKSMVSVGLITVMTVGLAGAVVARKKED